MKNKNSTAKFLVLAILLISVLIISCKPEVPPAGTAPNKFDMRATQQLKKFTSAQEVRDFLNNVAFNAVENQAYYGSLGIEKRSLSKTSVSIAESAAPQAAAADAGTTAGEYSQTNIQVAGVDEADFVKNDGKYIYTVTQNKLVIVDAYPAENAKTISETKIEGRPINMFVNKDRLVVFAEGNDEVPVIAQYDFVPRPRYTAKTHIFVYDIADRSNPKLLKDYNLNGNYFEARMIGDFVYFIVRDSVYYYNNVVDVPVIKASSKTIVKPEIYYFDNPEYNYNFNTVASFNMLDDQEKVNAKTFMMGYSNVVYVSKNNIYITYQKNFPFSYYEQNNEERFYNVVVPLFPTDAQNKINEIKNDAGLTSYGKWDKISSVLEEMYNKMEKGDRQELIEKIEQAIEEYEAKLEIERRKTVIHKIKINDGNIDYGTKGEIPGYLLNQFSMDENEEYFRVATTTEFYGRVPILTAQTFVAGEPSISEAKAAVSGIAIESKIMRPIPQLGFSMYNNVYVLDKNLKIVGKIEAIAPDERIYSTRFIGDRLYMVTFKRVDPLFVIDLSNPKNPEILGKLKIPGFSDYLHPYDENHIIGVGKETDTNEWGGISTQGVKLALFDVSDVKNPKQLDKYEIGEAGTDSEALRDHKAFLFDKKKNVLVIPVTEVESKPYYDEKLGYYKQRFWQGAYVFGLTPEDGFKLKGKITHNEGDEDQNWYYYGSPNAVRRALFMDDALYTISGIKIKANDINNIGKEIKEIKLPYEKEVYYPGPIVY